ncbi:MAG: FAD:protein FMN transferase [Chthonomonadaceae bacterium]|nr:FAD:protein FMN transferase [Chthonomonadaceae bacterium]
MRGSNVRSFLFFGVFIALWFPAISLCCADVPSLARYTYTEYHMGVDVRIVVYAPNKLTAERACTAAFKRFAELDTIMSDYRLDSELMRLCSKAGGAPVRVSRDLFTVLQYAQKVAKQSDGAFDVTCGPVIALWRQSRKTHVLPLPEEIALARTRVGWRKMRLDARKRTVRLLVSGMKLDLGGIGKGYADDCAQKVLRHYGITCALVEAGGDIVVSNPPPHETGWKIGVVNATTTPQTPLLFFANRAISTSGDTEQFVEIGGLRYSHLVDPRTGEALTDRIQVTVIAPNGLTSDSLSKVVSVLGREKGEAIAHTYRKVSVFVRFRGTLNP